MGNWVSFLENRGPRCKGWRRVVLLVLPRLRAAPQPPARRIRRSSGAAALGSRLLSELGLLEIFMQAIPWGLHPALHNITEKEELHTEICIK